jgi:outer membrane protein OmpA-like peptidoglycan-associated protein
LTGSDAFSDDDEFLRRNFSFDGSLVEAGLQLVWEPFAHRRYPQEGGYKNIVSPYVFAGAGLSFFNQETSYGSPGIDGFQERIITDINADESPTINLPMGGGIRFDLSNSTSLGVEVGVRKTFTDYLDGVAVSANPDKDDWYVLGGITLSYRWSKPDYDRDGFLDDVDSCPQLAGVDYTNGCPDSDGDGIADDLDRCPYQPGKAEAEGCPDTDFDGVPDFYDDCPDYPGDVSGKGCLDTDGDGIKDDDDMCPDCPATNGISGCPDADGDGLEDSRDRCPNLVGSLEQHGCPFMDTDLDGIPDEDDNCPEEAGPRSLNGCPDTDGDGLIDREDKCPELAGSLSAAGCPEVTEEIKEALAFVTEAVQFETGSNKLKPSSTEKLDELVSILEAYPYYHLDIAGHTDSQGNNANNLRLSQRRAEACYDYLKSKGIAIERMKHEGFGEERPIASNKTAAGRMKNRRVTFELYVK